MPDLNSVFTLTYEPMFLLTFTMCICSSTIEIPNFLSEEECDLIIESAKKSGLNISNLFGEDVYEQFQENVPLANISRVSHQTWLDASNLDNVFFDRLQRRYVFQSNVSYSANTYELRVLTQFQHLLHIDG